MKYAYWLHNIPKISNGKIRFLYEEAVSAEEIYHMKASHLKHINGVTEEDIKEIQRSKRKWDIDKAWLQLMEQGIGFVSLEQPEFPEKVKNIPNPPYALYYVGKLPDENQRTVAIVGARARSAYGSEVAFEIGRGLTQNGIQVVSGLARGIDRDAHQGALEGGGETYGVLGCGVDVCYPREHRFLYEKIQKNGGLISEYAPGTPPMAHQFPARNRIISGLSDCVVIVDITTNCLIQRSPRIYAFKGLNGRFAALFHRFIRNAV